MDPPFLTHISRDMNWRDTKRRCLPNNTINMFPWEKASLCKLPLPATSATLHWVSLSECWIDDHQCSFKYNMIGHQLIKLVERYRWGFEWAMVQRSENVPIGYYWLRVLVQTWERFKPFFTVNADSTKLVRNREQSIIVYTFWKLSFPIFLIYTVYWK